MGIPRWIKRTIKWFFGTLVSLILLVSVVIYFFKDDLINYAIGEINKHLQAKIEVGSIDITFWKTFPNVSLDFGHVFVQDALPDATRKDTLLYTDLIRLKFNPIDVWNEKYDVKSISVAPGTLKLKIDTAGAVNYNILKPSESNGQSKFELNLEKIVVEGMRFSYVNRKSPQEYHAVINQLALNGKFTESKFNLHTEADMHLVRLQNGKVPFIVDQPALTVTDLFVDQEKGTVSLPNGLLYLSQLPFHLDVFVDPRFIRMEVKAKDLSLVEVANKLAVKEARHVDKYHGSGTASFYLKFETATGINAFPLIDCQFSVKNGRLTEPTQNLVLNNLQVKGNYSTFKGRGKEEVNLDNISFSTIGGPFRGNLAIRKFEAPRYTGEARGAIDLAVAHALFRLPKIDKLQGTVSVDADFALQTISDASGNQVVDVEKASGEAQLKGVLFQLLNDTRKFERINGKVILNQHEAALENLTVNLGKSDMLLNGHFDQIDHFLQDKANLRVEIAAQSNTVDLADFNSIESGTEVKKIEQEALEWLLPSMIEGDVRMAIGRIILGKHQFTDIQGDMQVGNRSIQLNQLYGKNAGIAVTGSVAVVETAPEKFQLGLSLNTNNLQFTPLFREWDNFDQDVITAGKISGNAQVSMDLQAPFDIRNGIVKNEIRSLIRLKVTNGELNNVEAFKAITESLKSPKTRLILKKDEVAALEGKLNHIQFQELSNIIYIKNSTITIPQMTIRSNVINVDLEGTHSFANIVDYHFAFRFRELKQKKDESEFGVVEDDGTGLLIYMRMHGPLSNPMIEWDKTARKEQAKQNREEAVKDVKSILKSDFGLFKKDTTVKAFQQQPKKPHEEIQFQFGEEPEKTDPAEEKKKNSKFLENIKKKTDKLKGSENKEKDVEFEVN